MTHPLPLLLLLSGQEVTNLPYHMLSLLCVLPQVQKNRANQLETSQTLRSSQFFFKKVSYFRCFILVMRILVMNLECFIYFEEQMYFDLDSVNEN